MTLDLWMGIAIGMLGLVLILMAFLLLHRGPAPVQRRNLDEANHLLRQRNAIGLRQCEALEAIAAMIDELNTAPESSAEPEPQGITIKVRKNTPLHAELLAARFPKNQARSPVFIFQGRHWRYEHTGFDSQGEYDLLWRPSETTDETPARP